MLTLQGLKKSRFGTVIKKVLHPVLPGWVDEGRLVVQGPPLRQMLSHVVERASRLNNAINAGAGEGLYSHLLLGLGIRQLVELDVSYSEHSRQRKEPFQQFLAASLTNLPLGDQTVDLILCSEVLEHIADDEAALEEIARVLVPGGWLLISVPTLPAVFDPAHVREGYSQNDLTNLLEAKGLEVIKVEFCMYAVFKFFLRSYRRGWVPRGVVFILAWLDRLVSFGTPMDLVILARSNRG
jgi:SAM-dependent methyltransferase